MANNIDNVHGVIMPRFTSKFTLLFVSLMLTTPFTHAQEAPLPSGANILQTESIAQPQTQIPDSAIRSASEIQANNRPQAPAQSEIQTNNRPQSAIQNETTATNPALPNPQPILKLEDTIRGNKEQPQVLTIVPWQLPVHQRIDEDKQWQLQVTPLPAIERNAFLKNLAVIQEIETANAANAGSEKTK